MTWHDPIIILAAICVAVLSVALLAALLIPSLPTIRQLAVGVRVPPAVVNAFRLLVSATGGTVLTALTGLLTRWEGTALAAIGAALIVLLHTAWGLLDQSLKRDQNASGPDTT
jgi:hypothetical protein